MMLLTRREWALFAASLIGAAGVGLIAVAVQVPDRSAPASRWEQPSRSPQTPVAPTVADLARTPVPAAPTTPAVTTPAARPAPDVYYRSCAEVRAAGKAPLRRGEPGYRSGLDRDGDGWACDT